MPVLFRLRISGGSAALPAIALAALTACAPSPVRGGFDSPNPAARLYAIERAARDNDRAAIPHIIEQLDSDDPAVRMVAIAALERLTGCTHGYRHYDPREEREVAVRRWVQWHQAGGLDAPPLAEVANHPGDDDSG